MNKAFTLKKAFTIVVAAATVLWIAGVATLINPMTASAASAGDIIKGETLSTVYYYGSDGSRYSFPNEKTYFTWYEDFSDVVTITDEELADIPLAGNIVYRPGSYWIKIQSSAKTYAVTPEGVIRWIETEDVAEGLAGDDWNQFIHDVPDVFFADYTEGTSLMDAADAYDGALVSGSTYLIWDGEKRLVTDDGMTDNGFMDKFLLDGEDIDLDAMTAGDDVTGYESELSDTAQLGEAITGGLEVSIASDTPASATIPASASAVPFFKFELETTTGTATVDGITLDLTGVGGTGNIDDVYLYDGTTRITNGRSVNSSTREVTFTNVGLDLGENESKTLTVRVDVNDTPTGGDTAAFQLNDTDAIDSSATVAGTFPIAGNTMSFSETDAGEIEIEKAGTISNPTLGENAATIGKFRLTADGEPAEVEQIALTIDKAADHENFELYQSGDLVATDDVSGDLVTFVFSTPFDLDDGESKTFEVVADIGGDAGDEITVALEETTDIIAIGGDFGFNLSVENADYDETGGACAGTGDDCSYSEIEGGNLTFAFNGPSTGKIAVGGDEQVLMDFAITSGQIVTVNEFDMLLTVDDEEGGAEDDDATDDTGLYRQARDTDNANFTDVKVIDTETGSTLMGPEELNDGDDLDETFNFDDQFEMEAGETLDLALVLDVDRNAADGDEVHAILDMSTVTAEDMNGDDLIQAGQADADIVPSTDLTGYVQELNDSSLEVTLTTPPGSGTWVKGTNDVEMVGFAFEAGDASDVEVTDVMLTAVADDDAEFAGDVDDDVNVEDKVSSCSLYDSESGSMIDGPESFSTDAEITFTNFGWDIPAGETKKMLVRCNLANVDPDNVADPDDAIAIEIAAADDISAQDEDGDDVDPVTLTDGNAGEDVFQTITSAGTLTLSLDGDSPKSTIILGSSTGVEVTKVKASADDEAFKIVELHLENNGAGTDPDAIANNVKITYEKEDGTEETKTGFLSANELSFSNLEWYVGTSEDTVATISIDTNSVSGTGATSGDTIQLDVENSAADEFGAIGISSGESLDGGDVGDVTGNEHTARKTKPTISLASGSPSGAGIPGLDEVFRFNVAADTRGAVDIHEFTFKFTSTDDASSGWNECTDVMDDTSRWQLFDMDDTSTEVGEDADWALYEDGAACAAIADPIEWAQVLLDANTDDTVTISAGDTKTFMLKLDTTGASSSDDDSIRIDIETEDNTETGTGAAGVEAVRWSDGEDTDIEGDLLKELPVNGGTIVY